MARIRYIKPSFFTSDNVAALPPLVRLLFQGLWCLADREGILLDRPARIRAEVMPYDKINVEHALTMLHERGFICRFEADDERLIHVSKFHQHQKPHHKEPASMLHACPIHEPCMNHASTVDESTMSAGTGTGTGTGKGNGDRDGDGEQRRSARQWYEHVTGQPLKDKALRQHLDDLQVAHGFECIGWAFTRSIGKQDPLGYTKAILDHCLQEGHGPRGKRETGVVRGDHAGGKREAAGADRGRDSDRYAF